ncbi:MAG: hypothetical protein HON70_41850, partial [Lentisphaerae bacterium]|nr:hypothetical protein [Lentisphaerota bacterium]
NQTVPTPIVASAYSKAENVSGGRNSDYSLYLDVIYADGEPKWGLCTPFDTQTHDWQRRQVVFMPDKPIRHFSCYVLMRRHSGRAWFRDVEVHQIKAPEGVTTFDGVPVKVRREPVAGFQIRDVAAATGFVTFEEGTALDLALSERRFDHNGTSFVEATVRDLSGGDRAVSLVYAVPLPRGECTWMRDPRRSEVMSEGREYAETARFQAGANGRLSTYPFGAVTSGTVGLALAADVHTPAFCRFGANVATRELFVVYDIGLSPEKPTATIRFCRYGFEPDWGFRAALQRLYAIFPEGFRCRTPEQGLWMPFAKISEVEGWKDFGFTFKEGNNETQWDDAHGMTTFRYTEPMTWWMRMPKGMERSLDAALELARKLAADAPDSRDGRKARSLLTSGYHDAQGRFAARLRDTPWCNGAVWSMNSMPNIDGDVTDFSIKWNAAEKERLYGPERKGDLDGEYVDSSEGYVTDELDFRRDHLAAAETPLTFCLHSRNPAIFRGLIAFEYIRGLERDVHRMGKLMMANSTPIRLWFLAPLLDVLGSESNWNHGNVWRPPSDRALLYRRALCGPKPYCFLQNTVFEDFSHSHVENYMKRSLAYGMFPGFFSADASTGHYFRRPELYNRDRDLFMTYIPLCKRVAEAGWQPVTNARSSDPEIYVERFGTRYLTVFNPSEDRRETEISVDVPVSNARDLVSGQRVPMATADGHVTLRVTLNSEDVAVLDLQPGG